MNTRSSSLQGRLIACLVAVGVSIFAAHFAAAQTEADPSAEPAKTGYALGAGDKLKITVFGEEDLSGEFEVDGSGTLAFPLLGNIKAGGLTPRDVETAIASKLSEGFIVNPRVNIEVLNARPFFILGEVNKPGSYPYVSDMRVINAITVAGGYTPRARTGRVMVRKAGSSDEVELLEDASIQPGDVVRVTERFF